MRDAITGIDQKKEYVRCSVVTPTGCMIRCMCGNVFSPADPRGVESCPECSRVFQPGFTYDIEVLSRRSGMSLASIHGEQVGSDLNDLVNRAVVQRFGPECDEFCTWQIKNHNNAYFDVEREESDVDREES